MADLQLSEMVPWLEQETEVICRKTALDTQARESRMTPVLSGRARAGWGISVGAASEEMPSEGETSYPPPDLGRAIATLAEFRLGDDINVTNNLPYIERLNAGWSKKAPAGFVDLALEEALRQEEG